MWSHPQMDYFLQIVEYLLHYKCCVSHVISSESLHVHLTLQVPGCSHTVRLQVTGG